MFRDILEKVIQKNDLTEGEMSYVMQAIMNGELSDPQMAAILTALRVKGESIVEIATAAKVMRKFATSVEVEGTTLDTCGTGGDGLHSFNISTVSAFILAAGGVKVLKHGNRSVSSKCGSADLLESLGVGIVMTPEQVVKSAEAYNFAFMFAPSFHKSTGHAVRVRKALGVRTVFNILGPLSNPAAVTGQVLGVFKKDLLRPMAEVLNILGTEKALIVHGRDGMDEITLTDVTDAVLLDNGRLTELTIDPRAYGMSLCVAEDLMGGDVDENKEIALSILTGESGAKRDIVILNAGAGFWMANKANDLAGGIEMAREILDSKEAYHQLNQMITSGE